MAQQQSVRHHYIPVFYLEAWTGADGMLCEISRPRNRATPKRVAPKATGFERHLYTVTGIPADKRSVVEDDYFQKVDGTAAEALQFMLQTGGHDMPDRLRRGWARFILSLRQRNPEKLAELKRMSSDRLEEILEQIRGDDGSTGIPSLPEGMSFGEFATHMRQDVRDKIWAEVLLGVIDTPRSGLFLANMRWSIVTVTAGSPGLLTSDRPVIMTNGLDHADGELILPISPTQVFLAVNSEAQEHVARGVETEKLRRLINEKITRQAKRFVYAQDDKQLRFVENRLCRNGS